MKKLILAFTIFVLTASTACASTGLTISPATLELLLAPNKQIIQNVTLTNNGERATYQVSLHKLIPLGENGENTLDPTPLDPSSIPYVITVNNSELSALQIPLEPDETITLSLKISSASTDTSTSHALILSFHPESKGSLAARPMLGLPLLLTLTPDGNLDMSFELEDFDLPLLFDSQNIFAISPKLKNTSSFMHRPTGELLLTDPTGQTTKVPLIPNLILGNTTRALTFNNNSEGHALPPSLKRFGPHIFTLSILTPGGKEVISESHVVWFLPLKLLTILLIFLLSTTFLYFYRTRQKNTT